MLKRCFFFILLINFGEVVKGQSQEDKEQIIQRCIDSPEIQTYLKKVDMENHKGVLVVLQNEIATNDLNLQKFGKKVLIVKREDLFFHGIKDFIDIASLEIKSEKATLTISTNEWFIFYLKKEEGSWKITHVVFQ